MTTTVTLKTHDWPVKATINDRFENEDGTYRFVGLTEQIVAPHTEITLYVTSTRSITFDELPIPAAAPVVDEEGAA